MIKSLIKIGVVFGAAMLMTSCFNKSQPNYQYFPNMYEPVGYEAYQEVDGVPYGGFAEHNMEAQIPAEGSVKRGWLPYEYENTNEGYEAAKAELKSPLVTNEENMAKGKELYGIYCAICHGNKGDGQGILMKREKFLGIPAYNDAGRAITEGSIYHVLMYGKNNMGSHASQLDTKERWQVVQHVLKLKADLK
ncbi:c-type cytochrome [Kordia jejudonensis]|uniref:c-type cytochrome n=1 Tax=Kordia jejudonensis TaxID=1348245 RepID=UPI000A915888|nr:cytochrome c [Kordia jejudonensis]